MYVNVKLNRTQLLRLRALFIHCLYFMNARKFYVRAHAHNTRDFTIRRRDGNENVKNNNRFRRQNNSFAHASHFLVHFFAVFARLRREIA